MNILIDITHPAHVHFFRNAINKWRKRGNNIIIVARKKDVTLNLLDAYGYQYICISHHRKGILSLGIELIEHESRLFLMCLRDKPDIFLEIGGTFIVHAAALLGKPSIVFSDTEHAKLSNAITYPFTSVLCTPSSYIGNEGKKHVRYNGSQELAYLHPKYFSPNPDVLKLAGLEEGEPYFVIRFISWEAAHDVGLRGLSYDSKCNLVERLSKLGRVIISSENALPTEFQPYQLPISPSKIHDLLYYSKLYIGEGATMASEAAILGTPSIYVSTLKDGIIDEESKYGIIHQVSDGEKLINKAIKFAKNPDIKDSWRKKSKLFINSKIDVTAWMVDFVENYPLK